MNEALETLKNTALIDDFSKSGKLDSIINTKEVKEFYQHLSPAIVIGVNKEIDSILMKDYGNEIVDIEKLFDDFDVPYIH